MEQKYELHFPDAEPFSDEFCKQGDIYDTQLTKIITENIAVMFSCSYGFYTVTPSAKQKGYIQVTFFDSKKIPAFDSQYDSNDVAGIIRYLSTNELQVVETIARTN